MADINKPDLTNLWASDGAVIPPSPSKIQTGWVAEIPPHQWENYVQNRQDVALAYLLQKGVPEWDNTTEYIANKSVVTHDGNIYFAIQTDTNRNPSSSPSHWIPLEEKFANSLGLGTAATRDVVTSNTDSGVGRIPTVDWFFSNSIRTVTFNQAISLNENVGPIFVIGMDGIWEWVETPYFTGYRHPYCGMWMDGWTPTPLPFQIEATGGTWSESDEKERRVIARYRESGLVVPIGEWIPGQNMIADQGGGDWKAADLRNMFKRMTGTDVDTANARTVGSTQSDAIRNITGYFNQRVYTNQEYLVGHNRDGVFAASREEDAATVPNPDGPERERARLIFDASRVVPTSSENRPVSTAVAPLIHV